MEKNMVDGYTKSILTLIAAALVALVIENVAQRATAQGFSCGNAPTTPCYSEVSNRKILPLYVSEVP